MQRSAVHPAIWLRAEGAAALLLSIVLYAQYGAGWTIFLVLLLVPDLSMVGYLRNARAGALLYNAFHTYVGPLVFGAAAIAVGHPLLLSLSLIWSAHIGMDRALGYGLKLSSGFRDTHLGRIGRSRDVVSQDV